MEEFFAKVNFMLGGFVSGNHMIFESRRRDMKIKVCRAINWLKFMGLIFFFVFFIMPLSALSADDWDKGGSLQNASVYRWMKASAANRLATSADWFLTMTRQSNKPLLTELKAMDKADYEEAFKYYAIRLESCISEKIEKKSVRPENRVSDYAEKCYQTLHGNN